LIRHSKLAGTGTTIFSVMSKMAEDHGAINLSQGFPDFEGPEVLRERVTWHMEQGHNQYAPLAGVEGLLEQISLKVQDLYGYRADPGTQIVVTPGATEAIYCAVTAVVHPGDEVIIFDPAYDTYEPCVRLNGGVARRIPLQPPGFGVDWDRVRDCVNERTRLIMLNTPHNPTGAVWNESDIEALREVIADRDVFLVSDEVYEHITFDGKPHLSMLRYPDLAERAFSISSFGKTYHVTGWRVGYCVASPGLMKEFMRIHQFINFSAQTPMQHAIADFMQECPECPRELGNIYQHTRDLFCGLLERSRFQLIPAEGTYFQLADYSGISEEPDTEFAARLTREHGVAAIPVSVFCENPTYQKIVRFCFAKSEETLRQATRRLCTV
jgi:methionine aminotransferase